MNASIDMLSMPANAQSQLAQLALSPKQLNVVQTILKKLLPNHHVWVFGSRATGRARKYSDLDLAVSHLNPSVALSFAQLCQLSSAFEDSGLDICVDIIDWHQTDPAFRQAVLLSGMIAVQ